MGNNPLLDVLLCVGVGFVGMLAVAFPLFFLVIWAAEKWLTRKEKKTGRMK